MEGQKHACMLDNIRYRKRSIAEMTVYIEQSQDNHLMHWSHNVKDFKVISHTQLPWILNRFKASSGFSPTDCVQILLTVRGWDLLTVPSLLSSTPLKNRSIRDKLM